MQLQALPGRARLPCSLPTPSHPSLVLGSTLPRPLPLPHCATWARTLPPRRPANPRASPQQGVGGSGNSSDSDSEQQQRPRLWPPVMRSLDNPDSMKRQDEPEGSSSSSNTLVDAEPVTSSMDESLAAAAGGQQPQGRGGGGGGPLHPLQRIAIDLLSKLAALAPPWLRVLFSPGNTRRALAMAMTLGVVLAMGLGAHLGARRAGPRGPQEVSYSEFVRLVESGNVRAARFEEGSASTRVTFDLHPHSSQRGGHVPAPGAASSSTSAAVAAAAASSLEVGAATVTLRGRGPTPRQFYTHRVGGQASEAHLLQAMLAAGVEFGIVKASVTSTLTKILVSALALWIPLLPLFLVMRRILDERMGGSRKKKKGDLRAAPRTTFADVAGVGSAKEELAEVVACLKNSGQYQRMGAKTPSGVLLVGPPGTGKTLLARAVAGEAGVPFFSASASEFVELFVGRGAARIRELFAEARKKAPCVVFIDELDAVGGKRGLGLNEERDQTLNQLLTELDGFEGRPGVVLLAATNRPDVLDSALVRPGRLSRKVVVPLPDEEGRAEILRVHVREVPLADDPDRVCPALARVTGGFSGAELANVVNEAALLSARRGLASVAMPELMEAVYRTKFGVNGGQPVLPFGLGLQKKLMSWLVDMSSSSQSVRTQPLGP